MPRQETRYDAFISYSHSLNSAFAPALQEELQRIARPWYRQRTLKIFRDDTNLTAGPGLWPDIEKGLRASSWFVLLASPDAARSTWVRQEVEFWLRERSPKTMLIALVDGTIAWAGDDFDWSRTNALPSVLSGKLAPEPRWVDFTWALKETHVDRADPRFWDCAAELAARLRDIPKDDLIGEHIKWSRRNRRTAVGAVSVILVLLIVAIVAAVSAGIQRDLAEQRATIATARLLASAADEHRERAAGTSQLLAVESHSMWPSVETRGAVLRSVAAHPELVGYLPAGGPVTALASTEDHLAAATENGRVSRWRTSTAVGEAPQVVETGLPGLRHVALSADGERIAAADGKTVLLYDFRTGARTRIQATQTVDRIAVAPEGDRIAVFDGPPAQAEDRVDARADITVYDATTGNEIRRAPYPTPNVDRLSFNGGNTVLVSQGAGRVDALTVHDGVLGPLNHGIIAPAGRYTPVTSSNGLFYAFMTGNELSVWPSDWTGDPSQESNSDPLPFRALPDALALSDSGRTAAAASDGKVVVANTNRPDEAELTARSPAQLDGNSTINKLEFSGESFLLGAAGDSVALWDLRGPNRLATDTGIKLDDPTYAIGRPPVHVSDNGRLAVVQEAGGIGISDNGHPTSLTVLGGEASYASALWLRGGRELLVLDGDGNTWVVDTQQSMRVRAQWVTPADPAWSTATTMQEIPGDRVVTVSLSGHIVVSSVRDGGILREVPRLPEDSEDGPQSSAIDPEGRFVALAAPQYVRVVDLETGAGTDLPGGGATEVAFTPDGELLAQRVGGMERWDLSATRPVQRMDASRIDSELQMSPDGNLVAGLGETGEVVLLDTESGRTLGSFSLPQADNSKSGEIGDITSLAFSADSSTLYSATTGGAIIEWPTKTEEWIRRACATAGRDLSPAEWLRIVGTEPPADLSCTRGLR